MSLRNIRILLLVLIALEAALLIFGPQAGDHTPAINAALAAKARPPWWDDAAMGVRYAAWINLALLLLLLGTSAWWTRPTGPPQITNHRSQSTHPKWFWPLAIVAVITCLGFRLPLASKSLWWDEAWVVMQVTHGKWNPDPKKPGNLKFQAHDWKRCAFYYQKPTNHVPMSLAQKASFNVWRLFTGQERTAFNDLAARIPALIASCAAVLLLACLLRDWGRPRAAIVAAFVLAVHPWHIRYGVDARAYALVVPLCIAGMFAVTRIIRCNGSRPAPWLCWGGVQFLWIWAFPNGVLDVAALNLVALLFLVRQQSSAQHRWAAVLRLMATSLFAAALLIQVFFPNLMQARRWAGQEADMHILNWPLLRTTVANVLSGLDTGAPNSQPEFAGIPWIEPVVALILGTTIVMVLLVGAAEIVRELVRHRRARAGATARREWHVHRSLPTAVIFSTAGFMLLTRMLETYFYPRFAIALLPALITVLCLSLRSTPAMRGLLQPVLAAAFLWLVPPAWSMFTTRPIAPLHDAALFVQLEASRLDKPALIACYGLGREVMPVYEPRCVGVEDAAGLEAVIKQARTEQRALFVVQGYNSFNRELLGSGFKLLDDRTLFDEVKAFPGIDPEFYFRVFRLK